MTYKEQITAILECYFAGFKKEIIDSACNRILEQEPCKVSESDKDHIWYKGNQYISLRRFLEVKAEQKPKWIPVSENLPEENITVLGTTRFDDIYKTELYDDCGEKKWYANGNFDVPIVAWMPSPESYKSEDRPVFLRKSLNMPMEKEDEK